MTCQDHEIELGDYVDGTLEGDARAAFEAHLTTCDRCRALVADLGTLRGATLALEPEVPSPYLWTRISASIESERRPRWGFTWRTFASSAVAMLLVATMSWVGARLVPANEQGVRLAQAGTGTTETISVAAQIELAEAQYSSAIAGLETIAQAEQASLDTDTAGVLRANLTVIDGAIGESRAALAGAPDDQVARQSLFEALRSKLELLQDMVALINEMRKGDPEGAARIVSGLNQ
jgi:anti-sigma factor RsiW